jgi:hypothetical protein
MSVMGDLATSQQLGLALELSLWKTIEMPDKKWLYLPPATSPLDYPVSMSQYERESLAAEAKLAEERKIRERPKPIRRQPGGSIRFRRQL